MKQASLKSLTLALALGTLVFPLKTYAQTASFTIVPVVTRSDQLPGGTAGFFTCEHCAGTIPGTRIFNNKGDLIFQATGDFCLGGLFLHSGVTNSPLIRECAATPGGTTFFSVGQASLNDQGEAAILTFVQEGNIARNLLLLYAGGQFTQIVATGEQSPFGTTITGCGIFGIGINSKGEIVFEACSEDAAGNLRSDVYVYSNGTIRGIVKSGDPSPIGGNLSFIGLGPGPRINDKGEVLFPSSVDIGPAFHKSGLFLATNEGVKKIVLGDDPLPTGGVVERYIPILGDFNANSEVAFQAAITDGPTDGGVFVFSNGEIRKIAATGDPSPAGGKFVFRPDLFFELAFPEPRINNHGAVAFLSEIKKGSFRSAIFLGSTKAAVKVVAVGERLPSGEKIQRIDSYALNDMGEVAFFAYGKGEGPLGVFKAIPVAPQITSIKLKRKGGRPELRVNGTAMITNDTVIEVNGVALEPTSYPAEFRENGGTTTRVVSRDSRLDEMIPAGATVQVRVFNPLTNVHSGPMAFTR
ncbi:MAG TPA: choice-of-anchor tandem repeat NxxGxxAF-containing protein [Blastocatellia bacterium]|nr:choice-of-anchor tandem repeat NxxGxxAF-containing protein [Blastocatellia bacterium]